MRFPPGLVPPARGLAKFAAVVAIAALLFLGSGLFASVQAPQNSVRPPLAGYTITVDPGHGGIDPGCHMNGITEKAITLRAAVALAQELEALGAEVFLTRTEDIELSHLTDQERTRHRRDLRARVLLSETHGADLLVSLHVNSAASPSMRGAMTFYHPESPEGKALSHDILESLKTVMPGNQNAALPANFFLLRHSSMPSVLIEMGFLSHPAEREVLMSEPGTRRVAAAIAEGIVRYAERRASRDEALSEAPSAARPVLAGPVLAYLPPLMTSHPCIDGTHAHETESSSSGGGTRP